MRPMILVLMISCFSACSGNAQEELAKEQAHTAPAPEPTVAETLPPEPAPAPVPVVVTKVELPPQGVLNCRNPDGSPKRQITEPGEFRFDLATLWSKYGQEEYVVTGLAEYINPGAPSDGLCKSTSDHFVDDKTVVNVHEHKRAVRFWYVDGAWSDSPPKVPAGQPVPKAEITVKCIKRLLDSCVEVVDKPLAHNP